MAPVIILRYYFSQTYIKSMDKDFVAATIQAIGRCATNIGEVRDTCLNGLVQLLSNRDGEPVIHSHLGITANSIPQENVILLISD